MGLCAVSGALCYSPSLCRQRAKFVGQAIITRTTPTANIYGFEILIGVGAGCQAQTGYAVMQAIVDPLQVFQAISFMLLGKILGNNVMTARCNTFTLAQLIGLTLGLSIAGSVFVNKALEGLQHALPSRPRAQLLSAITGTSGDLFSSLSHTDQIIAANTLTIALRKV